MAFKVNWTNRALTDLAEIAAYIGAQRSSAAEREGAEILRKVDMLEQFPMLEPVYRQTVEAEYRELLSGKFRVFYYIRPDSPIIDIVAIRHGARAEPISF